MGFEKPFKSSQQVGSKLCLKRALGLSQVCRSAGQLWRRRGSVSSQLAIGEVRKRRKFR